jgi:acyl-CoA thioester hydrolase
VLVKRAAIFRAELRVEADDIDALGHASNVAFVRWIQDVAVAHALALGFDLAALQRTGGVFVVVRHEVDYLRPALRGDALEARTWISSLMAAKCVRETELLRGGGGPCLARARTTWGFISLTAGRPMRVPEVVRTALAPYVDDVRPA